MRILKVTSIILLLPVMAFYFSTCSTAEQTTAKLAYDRGDFKKAEEEFMKEVKQNPSNEEAWFYLAMTRVQLKNIDGTKEAIDKYKGLKLNSFRQELLNAWGTLIQKGEKLFEEGAGFLKKNDETNAIKKYSEAVDEFQLAYTILPDSAFVKDNINIVNDQINTIAVKPLIDKGVDYEKQGNFEAAVGEYMKAKEKIKPGNLTYEVVIYDISLANLKWGEQMRKANDQDTTYKDKYRDALPYLEELTSSKEVCTRYNTYMLLVQVYANTGMSDKALEAIATRDKLKSEHPECVKEENK